MEAAKRAQTILVIEDQPDIADLLRINLQRADYHVLLAATLAAARELILRPEIDLVLLDLMLPDGDGLQFCRQLRSHLDVPIIILTARGEDQDRIAGLEGGADDYVTKPFNPRELVARVRAILRRVDEQRRAPTPLRLDTKTRSVDAYGQRIELTPKEYDLLALLVSEPGRAFSRDELLDHVWGEAFFGDHKTVDVHVRRLREKIERDPSRPQLILTVWGHGYRLAADEHPA